MMKDIYRLWDFFIPAMLFIFVVTDVASAQQIVNVPPAEFFSGDTIGTDTVVNVLPRGRLQNAVAADGGIVNLIGGEIAALLVASGGRLNLDSGYFSGRAGINQGGEFVQRGGLARSIFLSEGASGEISGGRNGSLETQATSSLLLKGSEFAIDGIPVSGLDRAGESVAITLPQQSSFTGVFSDGTPFGHYQQFDIIADGTLHLERTEDLPVPEPSITNVTDAFELAVAGANRTLIVTEAGKLSDDFRAGPGSEIEVNGGEIGTDFVGVGTRVILNEGTIRRRLNAYDDTIVTVNGGFFSADARLHHNSTLIVNGGEAAGVHARNGSMINLEAGLIWDAQGFEGSVINVTGGQASQLDTRGVINVSGGAIDSLSVNSSSAHATLSGGRISDDIQTRDGARISVYGSDFRLNGNPIAGLNNIGDARRLLTEGRLISGVLSDGTPFAFHGHQEEADVLRLVESEVVTSAPQTFNVPADPVPKGLRKGQSLVLEDGGELPDNFTAIGASDLTVNGGSVGRNLELIETNTTVNGGHLVGPVDAFLGTEMVISGDATWSEIAVHNGARLTVKGASAGNTIEALPGSNIHLESGAMQFPLRAEAASVEVAGGKLPGLNLVEFSTATITGGEFTSATRIASGSELILTGGNLNELSFDEGHLTGTVAKGQIEGGEIQRLVVHRGGNVEVIQSVVSESNALGGTILVQGGALGDGLSWRSGLVELQGFDFRLDGVPIPGLEALGDSISFNYPAGSILTGVLSDGTPFNVIDSDPYFPLSIVDGVLRLTQTDVPALPANVAVPSDEAPLGAVSGQTVLVEAGGALRNNFVAGSGSTVDIRAGIVGDNFEAIGSQVSISGGEVGQRLDVFQGANVTVSGGRIGQNFDIHSGGVLNLTGGELGHQGNALGGTLNMTGGVLQYEFSAGAGSQISINGGTVERGFRAESGSTINVMDGTVDELIAMNGSESTISGGAVKLTAFSGSVVRLQGGQLLPSARVNQGAKLEVTGGVIGNGISNNAGESFELHGFDFQIDGVPIENLALPGESATIHVEEDQLFTGVLADGTPFLFTSDFRDRVGTVTLIRSSNPPVGPSNIQVPRDPAPHGIHGARQLDVLDNGELPDNFGLGRDSVLNVLGGVVGDHLEAYGSVVNVTGGRVGGIAAFRGSEVHVSGGTLNNLTAFDETDVFISGGSLSDIAFHSGAKARLSGGTVNQVTNSGVLRIDGQPTAGLSTDPTISSMLTMPGSVTSISGGEVLGAATLNGEVIILGGSFQQTPNVEGSLTLAAGTGRVNLQAGSSIVIEGMEFSLDGVPLVDLTIGNAVDVEGDIIAGTLSDGTPFQVLRQFAELVQVRLTSLMGDFDGDGRWTPLDANQLCQGIALTGGNATLDVNRDMSVDAYDLNRFLSLAGSMPGDSDLNGRVEFADFLALSGAFGQDGGWSGGDFNCDGHVGFDDFLVQSSRFGISAQPANIPEPQAFFEILAATMLLLPFRGRRRRRPSHH